MDGTGPRSPRGPGFYPVRGRPEVQRSGGAAGVPAAVSLAGRLEEDVRAIVLACRDDALSLWNQPNDNLTLQRTTLRALTDDLSGVKIVRDSPLFVAP